MIFHETEIGGVFMIEIEPFPDARGFFARSYCEREFTDRGIPPVGIQCNISFNKVKGTVRGLHFQPPPHEEPKLVRCVYGGIFDVVVDLRRNSPTYTHHVAFDLTASNHRSVYIPKGCGHGFQTLVDETEVYYQMGVAYTPGFARGLRYDDQAFGISWPLPVSQISPQDLKWPTLQ